MNQKCRSILTWRSLFSGTWGAQEVAGLTLTLVPSEWRGRPRTVASNGSQTVKATDSSRMSASATFTVEHQQ